jgi:hypothetical protein
VEGFGRGKMKKLIAIVTACACLGCFGALSQEKKAPVVLGVGSKSCGSWTQVRRAGGVMAGTYESWIAGFLSGSNSIISGELKVDILEQQTKLADAQDINVWIDNYCKSHPLVPISEAANELGRELIRRAARQ